MQFDSKSVGNGLGVTSVGRQPSRTKLALILSRKNNDVILFREEISRNGDGRGLLDSFFCRLLNLFVLPGRVKQREFTYYMLSPP